MEGSRRPINDRHVTWASPFAIKQAARAQHLSCSSEWLDLQPSTTFKDLQRTFNSRPSKNFQLDSPTKTTSPERTRNLQTTELQEILQSPNIGRELQLLTWAQRGRDLQVAVQSQINGGDLPAN